MILLNTKQLPLSIVLFIAIPCFAQKKIMITPDLPKLVKENKITTINRNVSTLQMEGQRNAIYLDGKKGWGIAWLSGIRFSNGTIEFDAKGMGMPPSYIGIAFHGEGESYDAIYFRPFNFHNPDPVHKSHSVQYISYPTHEWYQLRQSYPGKYESSINPSPDPDAWFHVCIVVTSPSVSVYVNGNKVPCLKVDKLNNRKEGKLGFWVGNFSDGNFANLKIVNN